MNLQFVDSPIYKHAKSVTVNKIYTDSYMEENSNTFFNCDNIKIFDNDIDIKDINGSLLMKFRKNILSDNDVNLLYDNMKTAAPKSGGRAEASGIIGNPYKTQVSKNGKILRLLKKKVRSGITGYYDNKSMFGTGNIDPCRATAFTGNNILKFERCVPILQKIDMFHKIYCPLHHTLQQQAANEIDSNYVIDGTCYTTVTVNKNFRTALHKDKGDYRDGIGILTVIQKGDSNGGYTLLPQYGIGVNCRSRDLLFMDVHQWHCNSEIFGDGVRLSFVLYLRDKMRSVCPRSFKS